MREREKMRGQNAGPSVQMFAWQLTGSGPIALLSFVAPNSRVDGLVLEVREMFQFLDLKKVDQPNGQAGPTPAGLVVRPWQHKVVVLERGTLSDDQLEVCEIILRTLMGRSTAYELSMEAAMQRYPEQPVSK